MRGVNGVSGSDGARGLVRLFFNSRLGWTNFAHGKINISQSSATTNAYLRPQRELLTAFNGRPAELCD